MFRTDAPGHVGNLYSGGNPLAGVEATVVLAECMNSFQEEIVNAILGAGLSLNRADNTELRQAIAAAGVPGSRTLSAGGLVTGGGDLTANRTFTVTKASSAEVAAGTRDDVAITPLALRNAFSAGIGTNGYYILPGGLIIQWGQVRGLYSEGSVSVTLPTSFPNAFFACVTTGQNSLPDYDRDIFMQNVSRTLSGFVAYANYDGSGDNRIDGFDFFAVGN